MIAVRSPQSPLGTPGLHKGFAQPASELYSGMSHVNECLEKRTLDRVPLSSQTFDYVSLELGALEPGPVRMCSVLSGP